MAKKKIDRLLRTAHNQLHCEIHPEDEGNRIMTVSLQPIIALIAGVLILVKPSLLNYIVAIYLIIIGVLGLIPY
jgi:hypothetical protein